MGHRALAHCLVVLSATRLMERVATIRRRWGVFAYLPNGVLLILLLVV